MFIDPTVVSWLLIAGASACAFMVGKTYNAMSKDEVIETTILWMIENNFVKAKKVNGEWELLDLDGNDQK